MKRILVLTSLGLAGLSLALLLALSVAGALYQADDRLPAGVAGKRVQVGDLSLRVLQRGAGRDILFIHGSSGVLEDFAPQLAALAPSFRVTAYDRPGHGYSSDGESHALAYNAKVALALIEKLGLQRVVVVGHSYGGGTVLALAALRSPRVSAYVVLDSAAYKSILPANPAFRFLSLPYLGVGLARAARREQTARRVAAQLDSAFRAGPPPPGFVDLRSQLWTEPKILHAMADEHWHYDAELAQQSVHYPEIRAPLYVASQNDDAPRRQAAQRLAREVKGAELVLLPKTGHYVQLEQADAVSALIRRAAEAP